MHCKSSLGWKRHTEEHHDTNIYIFLVSVAKLIECALEINNVAWNANITFDCFLTVRIK